MSESIPMLVTVEWRTGLPSLRTPRVERVLLEAFEATHAHGGFRICEYSIQANHLHLIVECTDRATLARRIQGLKVRIARRLNRLWGRTGRVFADRYHRRDLDSLQQLRSSVLYVLPNDVRHGSGRLGGAPDRYSSGRWFTGWSEEALRPSTHELSNAATRPARSWRLRVGWKRHGLISIRETPRKGREGRRSRTRGADASAGQRAPE